MSHKGGFDDEELGSWRDDLPSPREDSPPIQPTQFASPPPTPVFGSETSRSSILRRPLSPDNPAPMPTRYRPT
jgi:hypothetical protein